MLSQQIVENQKFKNSSVIGWKQKTINIQQEKRDVTTLLIVFSIYSTSHLKKPLPFEEFQPNDSHHISWI